MKYFIFLVSFLLPICLHSQTKLETTTWLKKKLIPYKNEEKRICCKQCYNYTGITKILNITDEGIQIENLFNYSNSEKKSCFVSFSKIEKVHIQSSCNEDSYIVIKQESDNECFITCLILPWNFETNIQSRILKAFERLIELNGNKEPF